jgi:hypothetical protein
MDERVMKVEAPLPLRGDTRSLKAKARLAGIL